MNRAHCFPLRLTLLLVLGLSGGLGIPAHAQDKRLVQVPISDAPSYAKRALVVGVTDYALCNPLHVCGNDAKEFADFLKTRMGFTDVTLMTDEPGTPTALKPTGNNLRRAIHGLLQGVVAGKSEVVLFYSGHGVRLGSDSDWLVPEDGDPQDVSHTCVNYTQIVQALNTARPKRAFLVTDACRSLLGGKGAGGSGFGKSLKSISLGPEVAEMQSCQPTEVSQEGLAGDFPESVFTHFLVKGLNGDPDALAEGTKNVTFDSLKEYVQGKVSGYVSSHFNSSQVPDGRATLGGMVLARASQEALIVPSIVSAASTKINSKDGAEMVYVAPGPFLMGDDDIADNPRHTVTLSGYYIYKNLVTVATYKKYCQATGQAMPDAPPEGWKDNCPMVNVLWSDAAAYCQWAGAHLPTEAQWEKAARGTDGRKYPWGNDFDHSRLWSSKSVLGDAGGFAPVGSFPSGASPGGALDMAGNLWQWCADWYDADYWKSEHGIDPMGPLFGHNHLQRGGSWWYFSENYFRTAFRGAWDDPGKNIANGFRAAVGP